MTIDKEQLTGVARHFRAGNTCSALSANIRVICGKQNPSPGEAPFLAIVNCSLTDIVNCIFAYCQLVSLELCVTREPRIRYHVTDVGHAGYEQHEALEAEPEAAVRG